MVYYGGEFGITAIVVVVLGLLIGLYVHFVKTGEKPWHILPWRLVVRQNAIALAVILVVTAFFAWSKWG